MLTIRRAVPASRGGSFAHRISTRTRHESVTNSIARTGVQRVEDPLAESRGSALGFPQSTRGHSMRASPTQSRERESRGSKTLWRGQGAAPLGFPQSARGHSVKMRSTESRERESRGSKTLWRSPEAAPLAAFGEQKSVDESGDMLIVQKKRQFAPKCG